VVALDQSEVIINLNDEYVGKGSLVFEQKRSQPLSLVIEKPDCKPYTEEFKMETRGFLVGCDAISIIGLVVDFSTGAIYRPEFRRDVRVERIDYDEYKFIIFNKSCPEEEYNSSLMN